MKSTAKIDVAKAKKKLKSANFKGAIGKIRSATKDTGYVEGALKTSTVKDTGVSKLLKSSSVKDIGVSKALKSSSVPKAKSAELKSPTTAKKLNIESKSKKGKMGTTEGLKGERGQDFKIDPNSSPQEQSERIDSLRKKIKKLKDK
tara:strand:- start:10562 stop:10999 length:438 start_codon:yes stop_codon:yes gene_type:complete